ncbi:hypothetical protein WL1483_2454 [Aeromonas schubertii]|uniref:Uncharacterized protein n=1 Tax=Aeromonas schubertii TaxID=652 RepID=A0A0S2SJI5_9GAMM|nr:hypothetical protein WL1483_2454 [Aeromonas schubertii]
MRHLKNTLNLNLKNTTLANMVAYANTVIKILMVIGIVPIVTAITIYHFKMCCCEEIMKNRRRLWYFHQNKKSK